MFVHGFSSAFVYMFMKTTPQIVITRQVNIENHEDDEPLLAEVSVRNNSLESFEPCLF